MTRTATTPILPFDPEPDADPAACRQVAAGFRGFARRPVFILSGELPA